MASYVPSARAYATGLRSYAANPFSSVKGSAVSGAAMSPHLSQAPPIDPDLIEGYAHLQEDPQAQKYNQTGIDVNRLWKLSPTSPFFQPGYQHNQYAMAYADELRRKRELAANPPPAPTENWSDSSG